MKHYGVTEEEARSKRHNDWGEEQGWRKPHLTSLKKTSSGAIVLASVPTGVGLDLMMGSRLEVWLFPDGTYSADIIGNLLTIHKREGRIGKHAFETGCYLHPRCEDCPEKDCIAMDYRLVQRSS